MKEKQILVMIKQPGEEPKLEPLFDNTLEAFQEAVGGYIEAVTLSPKLCLICNEEGKILGLPYNVTIGMDNIVGPLIVCGVKGDEFASIPAALIPKVRSILGG